MLNAVGTRTITVGDGRELCLELAGDPHGKPILVHNGTPNSRHLFGQWIADADSKSIRLISYDRPGYGGSTALPGHDVASGAQDVRAIAEALGHDRLAVWGISGGGPYAVGCAALLPDLVVAVAAVASLAPYGVEGFDYFAGMGELNAEDIKLYCSDPDEALRRHHESWEEAVGMTAEQLADTLETVLSPVDAQALSGDMPNGSLSAAKTGSRREARAGGMTEWRIKPTGVSMSGTFGCPSRSGMATRIGSYPSSTASG